MYLKENAITLLESSDDINLNAAAETALYTCPAGKNCIITHIVLRNVVGAGLPLGTASISFGWNTGNADDVIANAVRAITAATNYEVIYTKSDAEKGAAAGIFKIDVQIAEGAVLTCTIDVFGYLY